MMVVVEEQVDAEWQKLICNWIVNSGCRAMMAWGTACEAWHDCVDRSSWDNFEGGNIPDDQFIMTSWHENEPLEEAFWFCRFTAFHPQFELPTVYIVHIATQPDAEKMLEIYKAVSEEEE